MGGRPNVYESIVCGIKRDIELGILREGDRLPSCREMALKLGVNPNTVQRAYSALEGEGLIYTLPKKGVYVADKKREDSAEEHARRALEALKAEGLLKEHLLKLLNELFGEDGDD